MTINNIHNFPLGDDFTTIFQQCQVGEKENLEFNKMKKNPIYNYMEIKELARVVLAVITDIRVPIALLGVFIFIFVIVFVCDSNKRAKQQRYTGTIKSIKQKMPKKKNPENAENSGETESDSSED